MNNSSDKSDMKKLSILLPTYNEKENIYPVYNAIIKAIHKLEIEYEIIFIDDNSPDGSITIIKQLSISDPNVKYILMSRRFGDQKCLMAGIDYAIGDAVITMDSDLQHPPTYIPQMIEQWEKGHDIVIMKRRKEGHKNPLKKIAELMFYKILYVISGKQIIYRFAGFSLLDKKVIKAIRRFREKDPFLRGIIALAGFNRLEIPYVEEKREFGRTKYNILTMSKLATTGITSFSTTPLYLSIYIGLICVFGSFLYALYVLYYVNINDISVPGWASTILVIIFLGGIQLLTIGILGIYIAKIFLETKGRPNYIVEELGRIDSQL